MADDRAKNRKKFAAEALGTFCLVFSGTGAIVVNDISRGAICGSISWLHCSARHWASSAAVWCIRPAIATVRSKLRIDELIAA